MSRCTMNNNNSNGTYDQSKPGLQGNNNNNNMNDDGHNGGGAVTNVHPCLATGTAAGTTTTGTKSSVTTKDEDLPEIEYAMSKIDITKDVLADSADSTDNNSRTVISNEDKLMKGEEKKGVSSTGTTTSTSTTTTKAAAAVAATATANLGTEAAKATTKTTATKATAATTTSTTSSTNSCILRRPGFPPPPPNAMFCMLTSDIANRDILLPYLKPSQRLELFKIPAFREKFSMEDTFCAKHGTLLLRPRETHGLAGDDDGIDESRFGHIYGYGYDDQIDDPEPDYNGPPKLGDIAGFGKEVMSKVLHDIEKDGKDVQLFRAKLANRTKKFPIERWEDPHFNLPEQPLRNDEEYGLYFQRLKKCQICESKAYLRQLSKRGMLYCEPCFTAKPLSEHFFCSKCRYHHGCYDCSPDADGYTCGRCESNFCYDCVDLFYCHVCDDDCCVDCADENEFLTCADCDLTACRECNDDFHTCVVCEQDFCYDCNPGGHRECCGTSICGKCAPSILCNAACYHRFCKSCVDVPHYCSACDEFSCQKCGDMMRCDKCGDVSCIRCMDMWDGCGDCGKSFCGKCCLRPTFSDLSYCRQCKQTFCSQACREMTTCDDCESRACTSCTKTCDSCCYTSCQKCLGSPIDECKACTFCGTKFEASSVSATKGK